MSGFVIVYLSTFSIEMEIFYIGQINKIASFLSIEFYNLDTAESLSSFKLCMTAF